jgi:hypothetical protein
MAQRDARPPAARGHLELFCLDGITSHTLVLVLSLSKDGPRLQMPWVDKLTTRVAHVGRVYLRDVNLDRGCQPSCRW